MLPHQSGDTDDCSAPEITGNTLNKQGLRPTVTVCSESVIRGRTPAVMIHSLGRKQEMTTHTRIRVSLCGLCQSQQYTHVHKPTHRMPTIAVYFNLRGSKIMKPKKKLMCVSEAFFRNLFCQHQVQKSPLKSVFMSYSQTIAFTRLSPKSQPS